MITMMMKPTIAFVLSNILLFLDNVSDLDLFFKLITFFTWLVYMIVAFSEKLNAIKKGNYLEHYGGSWKRYLIETAMDLYRNWKKK